MGEKNSGEDLEPEKLNAAEKISENLDAGKREAVTEARDIFLEHKNRPMDSDGEDSYEVSKDPQERSALEEVGYILKKEDPIARMKRKEMEYDLPDGDDTGKDSSSSVATKYKPGSNTSEVQHAFNMLVYSLKAPEDASNIVYEGGKPKVPSTIDLEDPRFSSIAKIISDLQPKFDHLNKTKGNQEEWAEVAGEYLNQAKKFSESDRRFVFTIGRFQGRDFYRAEEQEGGRTYEAIQLTKTLEPNKTYTLSQFTRIFDQRDKLSNQPIYKIGYPDADLTLQTFNEMSKKALGHEQQSLKKPGLIKGVLNRALGRITGRGN